MGMISTKQLLLVLFVLTALSHLVVLVQSQIMEERRNMPGGYSAADTEDARVVSAANFARQAMVDGRSYSFLSSSSSSSSMKVVVLRASQQVVAGMNYKLTLGLLDHNSGQCVGGFKCTIYDHFGDLSVTTWGEEVSCEEVMGMMKMKKEHDTTKEQDPETRM